MADPLSAIKHNISVPSCQTHNLKSQIQCHENEI
jgi:hypothetical protein